MLLLCAVALADPWSRAAAEDLAAVLPAVDGQAVDIAVEGEVPGWLSPALFTRILAETAGAQRIRPRTDSPPWATAVLHLTMTPTADGDLAMAWRLDRLPTGILGEGELILAGPRPPHPLDAFTDRADSPQIEARLLARRGARPLPAPPEASDRGADRAGGA